MSSAQYTKFAQDTFTREKALIEKLGLAKPTKDALLPTLPGEGWGGRTRRLKGMALNIDRPLTPSQPSPGG